MNGISKKTRPLNILTITQGSETYISNLNNHFDHNFYSIDKVWKPNFQRSNKVYLESRPTFIDLVICFDGVHHQEQAYRLSAQLNVPLVSCISILKEDVGLEHLVPASDIYIHANDIMREKFLNNKINITIPLPCEDLPEISKAREIITVENNCDPKSLQPIKDILKPRQINDLYNSSMDLISQLQITKYFIYPFKNINGNLIQAMKCGCIPIVPGCATMKTIIEHGKNGFMFHNLSEVISCFEQASVSNITEAVKESVKENSNEKFKTEWTNVFNYISNYIYRGQ